jgi:hypothetical protein
MSSTTKQTTAAHGSSAGTLDMLILRTCSMVPLTDVRSANAFSGPRTSFCRCGLRRRKQLVVEESQWKLMAEAVARVMWPAAEES